MPREKINWEVELNDVKEFIKPINVEIPINKGYYSYIFNGNKIDNVSANNYFRELENLITRKLYKRDSYSSLDRAFSCNISLSFIPDFKNNNWYIGYSPIELSNAILETLGLKERFDYIDYNDEHIVNRTKQLIKNVLIEHAAILESNIRSLEKKEDDAFLQLTKNKYYFTYDSINAIDNIFKFANFDMESRLKNSLSCKDLLYFLAAKSMELLDETDNELYGIIPKQYYEEVSKKGNASYPHQLFMGDNIVYTCNYRTFNEKFEDIMLRYPSLFETSLGIDSICVMDRLEILKNDILISELEQNISTYKKKKNYDKSDEELSNLLKEKMDFYKELLLEKDEEGNPLVITPIKGKNDLYGYYGFVLSNNYIVLDKFYNVCKKDQKMKPAKDEAIYSMPLDLFVELEGSKRKIMEYIKKHPKSNVKRNYHTKKKKYQDEILKVTKKENVSSMNYDWFINIFTPKKLVLNNNKNVSVN